MLPNPDSNIKNKLNLLRKLIRMYSLLKVKQIKNVAPEFCKKKKNDWNQSTCEIPLGQDPERTRLSPYTILSFKIINRISLHQKSCWHCTTTNKKTKSNSPGLEAGSKFNMHNQQKKKII